MNDRVRRLAVMVAFVCWAAPGWVKAATDLENGVPVTGLAAAQGEWHHFRIAVPTGATNLVMQITCNNGDADLYTRFGAEPTTSAYDCRPYESDSNETCTVSSPQVGYYYVSVRAYRAYSNLTLGASYQAGGGSGVTDLVNGRTVSNLAGAQGDWDYYRIAVPSDATSLQMVISGGSGDADLYTRFASLPTTSSYDCRPYLSGNAETCTYSSPSAGDYYIGLRAYSSYSGVSLTATYSTGGGGGDGTFIVSAVNDNLDNTDMSLMANGLISLGYTQQAYDTNVYTSEMISYLQQNITTYYHTGHGNDGVVMTYDGSVNANSATVNVVNTYFATCLTLTDTAWKYAFGANAQNIMGYTKVSYDGIDEDVVDTIIDELGDGTSYLMSWYLANVGIGNLQDRWAAYAREGSSIVEYSARTGNTPSASLQSAQWEALGDSGRLWIAPEVLQENSLDTRQATRSLRAVPSRVVRHVAEGEIDLLGPTVLTRDDAVAVAEAWLADAHMLPMDAELDRVVELGRRSEPTQAQEVVGHMVVYGRHVDGLKVRGNRVQDHIVVLVGPSSVVSVSSYWPSVAEMESEGELQIRALEPRQVVALAAAQIDAILKSASEELFFNEIEPVLGTGGPYAEDDRLVPAYELRSRDGMRFVIDASTGSLIF